MMALCGRCGTDDCDNCTEQKDYEIMILNYWDNPNFTRIMRAKTASAAKYKYWLRFSDCYGDMKFGDFVKIIKVRSLG